MPTRRLHLLLPVLLAAVLTGVNALKPPCVDDPAYLAVAENIARQPHDPYGFAQFWYDEPQPANEVLAPPVLPYWLGLGGALLGDSPLRLKLWLFPVALLLVVALRSLLRRFAPGVEGPVLVGLILSPVVLPAFNFMLDLPTLALVATALAIFLRALETNSWRLTLAAGLIAGLATQTKYTGGLSVPLLFGAAVIHRQPFKGLVAAALAGGVFVGWEAITHVLYGKSHFLTAFSGTRDSLMSRDWIGASALTLMGGIGSPLVASLAAALGRRLGWVLPVSVAMAAMVAAFLLIPDSRYAIWLPESKRIGSGYSHDIYYAWGWMAIAVPLVAAFRLAVRMNWKAPGLRISPALLVLLLWLTLEWFGYFTMTYFPAVRRFLGVAVVSTLIVAHLAARTRPRRSALWLAALSSATLGLIFAATDVADTHLEPAALRCAVSEIRSRDAEGRIWYTGHWGLQYEAERLGLRPLVAGQSVLAKGDWLITSPTWVATQSFVVDDQRMGEPVFAATIERRWPLRTLPSCYGGARAIEWWPQPMIELKVYRIQATWRPQVPSNSK